MKETMGTQPSAVELLEQLAEKKEAVRLIEQPRVLQN